MTSAKNKFQQKIKSLLDRLPFQFGKKINKLFSDSANVQTLGLWTSAIIAGFVAVAYAKLFRIAESQFHQLLSHHSKATFIVTPMLFLFAWLIVRRYAPEAAGSGIPQIMAANEVDYNGKDRRIVDRLLSLRTAVVKVLSSLLCILGGGAIGREGPTLQICTSVFHFFGQQVRRFMPNSGEQIWVVAGAASGLASAFNTPLGGIVYAIEELGLVHFHKIRTALLSGVIVSGLVSQWLMGSYLYLGYPTLTPVGLSVMPQALACGLITGLLGAGFGRLLLFFLNQRLAIKKITPLIILTITCGLVMAAMSQFDPRASGTGVDVISGFLFGKDKSSVMLIVFRFVGTMVSYLSGAAGGIFSPSLVIGGAIGSYLTNFFGDGHPHLMVLLGMIGFLTGVTRTPFTSFILVLEMTDRHVAIFPMMIVAITAQWISHLIDSRSFYEHVKEKYLRPEPQPQAR